MKQKILVTWPVKQDRIPNGISGVDIEVLDHHDNRYEQTLDRIHEYDGLVCITIPMDRKILERAKKLKIVANYGVGYDNVDIATAKKLGIAVSNTPQSTTNPTANLAMALMLSIMRRVAEFDRKMKNRTLGNWQGKNALGISIENKTLGIIGMGRIGKAMAKRASVFGMKVIYFKRTPLSKQEEDKYDTEYHSLESLLKRSDVVSIHTPLTDESRGLLGERELSLMKNTAFLVNTGRGGVVDEEALIDCMKNKSIAGAAFDVFENEPDIREEFLDLENMVITPHCGTGTHEARDNMMKEALGNAAAFLTGGEMTSRVA